MAAGYFGGGFKFSPDSVELQPGERVRFVIQVLDDYHTFTAPALGLDVELLGGRTVTVDAVMPQQPVEIRFYCKPHESLGMVGTLKVVDSESYDYNY